MKRKLDKTNRHPKTTDEYMEYQEIAKKLGITVREVKEAEASAIRKLKHPKLSRNLRLYLYE